MRVGRWVDEVSQGGKIIIDKKKGGGGKSIPRKKPKKDDGIERNGFVHKRQVTHQITLHYNAVPIIRFLLVHGRPGESGLLHPGAALFKFLETFAGFGKSLGYSSIESVFIAKNGAGERKGY